MRGKIRKKGKADDQVLHKEAREKRESTGKMVSKRDLPGKSSFERQLSGYVSFSLSLFLTNTFPLDMSSPSSLFIYLIDTFMLYVV
jgi:hypothetical protein